MKKTKLWLYQDPSVRLPYFMMKSKAWQDLSCSAQSLYCYIRMSIKDYDNGTLNMDERYVRFGPKDAPGFSHTKYYRALDELLRAGFIKKVRDGSHGRKAVYDILTLDWTG